MHALDINTRLDCTTVSDHPTLNMKAAIFIALCSVYLVVTSARSFNRELPVCPEPNENDTAIQLPNPDDCGTFYKCLDGEPCLLDCPAGLWFNPELSLCDWPFNIPEGICTPPTRPPTTDAPTSTTDAPTSTTDAPTSTTDAPTSTTDAPTETTDWPVVTSTPEATQSPTTEWERSV